MIRPFLAASAVLLLAACTPAVAAHTETPSVDPSGVAVTVVDTTIPSVITATGVASPIRESTLSTKLMSAVTAVLVTEGAVVRNGQSLLRLDVRDLDAKREQVSANMAAADAMHAQASAQAARMRSLFADSAAPKAMLEAAEAGLAQAVSAKRAAEGAGRELDALGTYAELKAPFAGVVTQRFVDAGALAAPGAPLLTVQDASTLRVTVHTTPDAVRGLRAGARLEVEIEGVPATATVEGVVPAMGGLYAVNALVENRAGEFLAGSSATAQLPGGSLRAVVVPRAALIREGDLVGVVVRTEAGDMRRWIRVGRESGDVVEVTSGLRAGDRVVIPVADGGAN
jgi:RND family efflux transporter MFP subunit